jgi:hypothetical protein
MVTPAPGHGRLRASHADREQVVDVLKAAFVQGRLTQDELDTRVGQALAARTRADLAALTTDLPALTADLPAEPDRSLAPASAPAETPAPAQSPNRAASRAVKSGVAVIAAIVAAISGAAVGVGNPGAAVVLTVIMVFLAAAATAFVAALIALALKVESRHRNRSRGQLPPGPASGSPDQATMRPPSAGPAGPARPHPRRLRRPPGALAVGRAS